MKTAETRQKEMKMKDTLENVVYGNLTDLVQASPATECTKMKN